MYCVENPIDHSGVRQQGAVLIVALVMLTLISLIAMGGAEMTSGDVKMATYFFERGTALQAAEAAIKEAEVWLEAQASAPLADDASNDRVLVFGQYDVFDTDTWTDTHTTAVASAPLATQARYLIEQRTSASDGSIASPDIS